MASRRCRHCRRERDRGGGAWHCRRGASGSSAEAFCAALGGPERLSVVTLGPRGVVARLGTDVWRVAAPRIEVVDTTGAGDAFVGALAAALDRGADVPHALCEGRPLGRSPARRQARRRPRRVHRRLPRLPTRSPASVPPRHRHGLPRLVKKRATAFTFRKPKPAVFVEAQPSLNPFGRWFSHPSAQGRRGTDGTLSDHCDCCRGGRGLRSGSCPDLSGRWPASRRRPRR
ncbi:MAG: hypothetical protein HPM95_01625 [Alphaproteobacteria bacterium]|nr:hypothetical protein [Alphaproteobacteria bacterium]